MLFDSRKSIETHLRRGAPPWTHCTARSPRLPSWIWEGEKTGTARHS